VNAPTGCGKTFSVFLGAVIQYINEHPNDWQTRTHKELFLLWVTPLRALAKDIVRAMEEAVQEIGLPWKIAMRNGDTETTERQKQKKNPPQVLVITPESLHLLIAQKKHLTFFEGIACVAVDEWHELIGSKRGVQTELAISHLVHNSKRSLLVWGISATVGNLEEAAEVLLHPVRAQSWKLIRAELDKRIEIISIIPDEIETYPWAGHLGIKLAEQLIPIIESSRTTLLFINTRSMSEIWYQKILELAPQLAGAMALHHGSIEKELRVWVEEALHQEVLKLVVCTASLDLGVDFRPVDTVIQVGSPKGVSRFLQRAGRSGHQPGAISKIFFLPTHSLELMEAAALKSALSYQHIEAKQPLQLCFDVLVQYLCTLATGDGFEAEDAFKEIQNTFCFQDISEEEWHELLHLITKGGNSLQAYDEFRKVEIEDKKYIIKNRRIALRHRMNIGTIVSDALLKVKTIQGKYLGTIEEWFVSKLEPGTVFTLAGRNLELIGMKDMTAIVKPSKSKKSLVPSWMGGRMPLSANLGVLLRQTLNLVHEQSFNDWPIELQALQHLFEIQQDLSHIPHKDELLIEYIATKDGYHLFVHPFEGRLVHEAMAAIVAYRISLIQPITFSIAMNDYSFELLSDQPLPIDELDLYSLFSTKQLLLDIQKSVNAAEMAKRKFRDIAVIGGLIFQGFPGEQKKARHLQSSASLLFQVFQEYEPNNVLLRQAYQEVFDQQMEEQRLRQALDRIQSSEIILKKPTRLTPFSFPVKVDGLNRENLSSEKLEDRVKRMQEQLKK
jgi:ATP-dependent Lhr-like helicase